MVKAVIPETLKEALKYLDEQKYRIVAGGTDMLIQHHNLTSLPIDFKDDVIYIASLEELQGISEDKENIYIGACEPLEALLESEIIPDIIKATVIEMASPAIRHTGTLGGNIGNASPAGDSLVTLYLLDTQLKIQSLNTERIVPLIDFITGVRRIALADNELITQLIIPKAVFTKAIFKKVGPRLSDAISKLAFGAAITIEDQIIKDLRFTFGAVNITVVRRKEIEEKYLGKKVEYLKSNLEKIIEEYSEYIRPINDQRSNKEYRKKVSLNLLRQFIEEL